MIQYIPRDRADMPLPGSSSDLLTALLRLRGIDTEAAAERFLNPSLEDLHDPFLLPGMREAVELLRAAAANGDPVLVWGDYDAAGVCAASILAETLLEEGVRAEIRLPC